MEHFSLTLLVALLHCVSYAEGYTIFQERIPNGFTVPHPCKPNYIWKGAGHDQLQGGGKRNAFGIDFAAAGYKWSDCICKRDSDGDGKTNGEELGDPDCVWKEGDTPKHKFGLSHPGFCEPVDDPECVILNGFEIDCETIDEGFVCPATHNPDMMKLTLRYPKTSVPTSETNYMCQTFAIPDDQEYHMIAYEPVIDNEHVMHHIVLYGCKDDEDRNITIMDKPANCDMALQGCNDIIGLWGLGADGFCFLDQMGIPIGKNSYRIVNVQMHWTNPSGRTDYVDSSGMTLYYTPVLRTYPAKTLSVGQYYLVIPPKKQGMYFDALCSADCTSNLNNNIYIANVILHMHYEGQAGYVDIWRNGTKISELVASDDYDYDRPDITWFDPPIELQPGDEIRVRCVFDSRSRDSFTYFGEGSFDEMCIAFLTYYPLDERFDGCGNNGMYSFCSMTQERGRRSGGGRTEDVANSTSTDEAMVDLKMSCDFAAFNANPTVKELWTSASTACDPTGQECTESCRRIFEAFEEFACMRDSSYRQIIEEYLYDISREMYTMLKLCDSSTNSTTDGQTGKTGGETGIDLRLICDFDAFNADPRVESIWISLSTSCDSTGQVCMDSCRTVLEVFDEYACMRESVYRLEIENFLYDNSRVMHAMLTSCNYHFDGEEDAGEDRNNDPGEGISVCDFDAFNADPVVARMWSIMPTRCDPTGAECRESCRAFLEDFNELNVCMRDPISRLQIEQYMHYFSKETSNMLHSCKEFTNFIILADADKIENETEPEEDEDIDDHCPFDDVGGEGVKGVNAASVVSSTPLWAILAVCVFILRM